MNAPHFFGKYRGSVVNNLDPLKLGRLQLLVPDVGASDLNWAMPCFPLPNMYAIAPVGAKVWVEFERGDPQYPIWTGFYHDSESERPNMPAPSPGLMIATSSGASISISDQPDTDGGVRITGPSGAMIMVNNLGILFSNGQGASINLTGPMVDINLGALTIV